VGLNEWNVWNHGKLARKCKPVGNGSRRKEGGKGERKDEREAKREIGWGFSFFLDSPREDQIKLREVG